MMVDCAWDDEEEHFHPVLRQMLPEFKRKMEKAEEKYLELKTAYELLMSMFEAEMAQEELERMNVMTVVMPSVVHVSGCAIKHCVVVKHFCNTCG